MLRPDPNKVEQPSDIIFIPSVRMELRVAMRADINVENIFFAQALMNQLAAVGGAQV